MTFFNDPAQQLFIELSRAQGDLNQKAYEQFASPQNAAQMAAFSTMHPQSSANLGLGFLRGGIDPGSEIANQLAMQEAEIRDVQGPIERSGEGFWNNALGIWDEWVDNPVKGATRIAFSAWDAAYNMIAGGAPIRAMMLSSQTGESFGSAFSKQDPYFFDAIAGFAKGENVNLGSGWMPNSDVSEGVEEQVNLGMQKVERETEGLTTNEKYAARLKASPGVWNEAVKNDAEQAAMGAPLTQLAAATAESVMFNIPRIGGGQSVTPWSPGRIGASTVFEPGTEGFKWASGTGDFLSQMFADPVEWGGLWWAKAGRAGRLLNSEVVKAADEIVQGTPKADPSRALARDYKWSTGRVNVRGTGEKPPESTMIAKLPKQATGGAYYDEATGELKDVLPAPDGPWWYSGQANEQRPLSAFDPPKWFVDAFQSARNAVRGRYAQKGKKSAFTKRSAGWYEIDMPTAAGARGRKVTIRKLGKGKKTRWEVQLPDGSKARNVPDDPRFTGEATFRTLKEARDMAEKHAYGPALDDVRFHGMTAQEMMDSGEEMFYPDGMQFMKESVAIGPSKNEGLNVLRPASRKGRPQDNVKVVVYGRTMDIADRKVAGKPQGLIDALDADRKLINGKADIAGNPSLDTFTNTRKWMEENGYGKLDLGDDGVLISEKFIGGDPADVRSRTFFDAGDKPMRTISPGHGVEPVHSVTPDEVNELVEMYARSGEGVLEDIDIELAQKVREGAAGRTMSPEIGGVRVDYDAEQATNLLHGKAADLFSKRLAATTRAAGQSNRAAMDKLLSFLEKQGIEIPGEFRRALFEAPDEGAARAVFARMLSQEAGGTARLGGADFGRLARAGLPPSAIGRGLGQVSRLAPGKNVGAKWSDRPFFARRAAMMLPSENVNIVENPEKAYTTLQRILPNYNISRGNDLVMGGETVVKADEVEKLFDMLADMQQGDIGTAGNVMKGFSDIFFRSLTGSGVHPDLAKTATRYFEEVGGIRSYDTARVGMTNLKEAAADAMVVADDLLLGIDGTQITAQAWDGTMFFPDAHTVKVIANESDKLGRISNRLANKFVKVGDAESLAMERRTWNLVMTNAMNRIWKPFVLLRAAWTIRIMMDDQLRIAGDGYDSLFGSPLRMINYALTRPKEFESALRKGTVDVFGEAISAKNVNNLQHGDLLKASMMSKGDPRVGRGSYGAKHRSAYGRNETKYRKAMATEVRMLRSDQITSALAASTAKDASREVTNYLTKVHPNPVQQKSWLAARRRLASFNSNLDAATQKLILAGDEETIYKLVSRQEAMVRQTLGGRVVFDDGVGGVRDYTHFKEVTDITSDMSGIPKWRVIDVGDEELLSIVGKKTSVVGDLDSDESMKGLQALIGRKVDENAERYPLQATMSDTARVGEDPATIKENADRAVGWFFEWFMSKPSDTFSRIPLFRQAYWKRIDEIAGNLSPEDFAKMADQAKVAGIRLKSPSAIAEEGLISLEKADELAKGFGLAQVESTLFDLVNKRNVSDSLNLVFPFVEAWGEFLTRWGRIMVAGDRNVANARRLQQGVEGLREDSGFFSENSFGDEVFNYPAFMTQAQVRIHNVLNNIPGVGQALGGDISPEVAGAIQQQGRAEGLNFMSSIIPGFGPVFQYAAKALPNDPDFDGLRNLVAPYGTEGGFSMFAPAWFKRVAAAHGGANDPTLTYQYTSTVQDVIRTYMDAGRFDGVTNAEQVAELVKKAEAEARGLLMVRAAGTYAAPTAPSLVWQKEDVTGRVWGYSALGTEWRKMEDELGEMEAFNEFYRRFGSLPDAFQLSKTYNVQARSVTVEGSRFQRANEQLFNRYPNSAMYLDPSIMKDSEYDHGAQLAALERGDKEQWTAEQMVYLQQDFFGDLMWDNKNKEAVNIPKGAPRNAFLANARAEVEELYPFWGVQIPGKVQGARAEEKMGEVLGWLDDPTLNGRPIIHALREYQSNRVQVLNMLNEAGASTISGPKSTTTQTGQIATIGREWLRDEAERITMMYPEFGPLFRGVFYSEVAESHDAIPEPEVDMWGDGDIFQQVLGVVSDSGR